MRTRFALLLVALAAQCRCLAQAPPPPNKEQWNKVFSATPTFNTKPNQFLVAAVKDRKPGKALEVGFGQGRNATFLAQQGWEVTGVDISEEGARIAREQAEKLGLKLHLVLEDIHAFDFGNARWDLVAGLYVHELLTRNAERIQAGLKPGGLLVAEGFRSDLPGEETKGREFGFQTNELFKAFDGLRILRYEDTAAVADWGRMQKALLVRLLAQKQ